MWFVAQSCLILCDTMDCSLAGSSVHRILQAKIGVGCHFLVEKAMAPHSSILAWKIPWMEEPSRLQNMGSLRVGHDWVASLWLSLSCTGEGNGNPLQCSCLENPGTGEPGWLPSMGSHRVGHDWSNLAAAAAAVIREMQIKTAMRYHLTPVRMTVI